MNDLKKNKGAGIIIDGKKYAPEEVGLEYVYAAGKRYIDLTPLFVDCGQATLRVESSIADIKARRHKENG